ncbi:U6 snRNA complex subunit LSM4 [Pneumocystis jirovecii RU7]|uniref:LSM complex subunit LSM4 n=1 Tax=Pneumocystis jirovecii (strain RU7) TaxID=1408657 RepID=A0A0W4ZHH0_PNEJ7|nr:U6 snRNA complex subunit LSM4 [Pneumocystis jirovecii RU7]KTW27823.1 hypothetical protein T551_02790 [Pneumocystis jirovecii RU7]
MLPLSLLTAAQGYPMLVELKNGETYNGHMVSCDTWMNLILKEVIQTNADGDRFFRLSECYIRGSTIKYLRIPDEIINIVKLQNEQNRDNRTQRGISRGGRGINLGRGRGMQNIQGRGGRTSDRGRGRIGG